MRLFISGSEGLIGQKLAQDCDGRGYEIVPFDVRRPGVNVVEDICHEELVRELSAGCDGIIHLAAISRVAWGEARPELCHRTNVEGTWSLLDAALGSGSRPWFLFASSREVYGNPVRPKVLESDPIAPTNHYGLSKARAEELVEAAGQEGLRTSIVRLSNVYGGRRDHPDRAVPSLTWRSLSGDDLFITGASHYFDFVHVDDCVAGLMLAMDKLIAGEAALPPIHLSTGIPTTLRDLAVMASAAGGSASRVIEESARPFDVSGFCGDPARAREILGWEAKVSLAEGVERVVSDFRQHGALDPAPIPDPDDSLCMANA